LGQQGGYRQGAGLLVVEVVEEPDIAPPGETLVVAGRITCQTPPNVWSPSPVAARFLLSREKV
jgi:hypothetical protein